MVSVSYLKSPGGRRLLRSLSCWNTVSSVSVSRSPYENALLVQLELKQSKSNCRVLFTLPVHAISNTCIYAVSVSNKCFMWTNQCFSPRMIVASASHKSRPFGISLIIYWPKLLILVYIYEPCRGMHKSSTRQVTLLVCPLHLRRCCLHITATLVLWCT